MIIDFNKVKESKEINDLNDEFCDFLERNEDIQLAFNKILDAKTEKDVFIDAVRLVFLTWQTTVIESTEKFMQWVEEAKQLYPDP